MLIAISFFSILAGVILVDSVATAQPVSIPAELLERFQERLFADADSAEHRYRLLTPDGYDEKASTTYPLVLFLHGAGERGDDNRLQLKHGAGEFARTDRQATYPCFVVAPQVPEDKKWVEVDWSQTSGKDTFADEPSPAMKVALGIVKEWIAGGRVDRSRVYVTGISMGGYGTWFAAAVDENPFAAAVPICGGGDPAWARRYKSMPIWTFHGERDAAVLVGRSREMIFALKASEHSPEVKYTEYEGGAHDVWTETYKRDDLFAWLFSQRK